MATDLNNPPPEVSGETQPTDPTVVGVLTEQENNALGMLRRQGQQIQMKIGEMEIQKARLLGTMQDFENQAQTVLTQAGKRMGVTEGQPFSVAPDGTVRLIPGGVPPNMG